MAALIASYIRAVFAKGEGMHSRVLMVGAFLAGITLSVIGSGHKSYAQLPSWLEVSPRLVGEAPFRVF